MSENEETAAQLIMIVAAFAIVPGVLMAAAASAGQWLLERGVLVDAAEAVLPVPFTEGGLDLQRVIVAVAAMVCILAIASTLMRGMHKTTAGERR